MTEKLTVHDGRSIGFCVQGQKRFCDLHGIDFKAYVRNGIDISEVEHIADAHLTKAISVARKRIENGQ
jgi:hypothetical protein